MAKSKCENIEFSTKRGREVAFKACDRSPAVRKAKRQAVGRRVAKAACRVGRSGGNKFKAMQFKRCGTPSRSKSKGK